MFPVLFFIPVPVAVPVPMPVPMPPPAVSRDTAPLRKPSRVPELMVSQRERSEYGNVIGRAMYEAAYNRRARAAGLPTERI